MSITKEEAIARVYDITQQDGVANQQSLAVTIVNALEAVGAVKFRKPFNPEEIVVSAGVQAYMNEVDSEFPYKQSRYPSHHEAQREAVRRRLPAVIKAIDKTRERLYGKPRYSQPAPTGSVIDSKKWTGL